MQRKWVWGGGVIVVVGVALLGLWVGLSGGHGDAIRHATANPPKYQRTDQTFDYSAKGTSIAVSAPRSNTDGNLREFFWNPKSTFARNQESCITFDDTANSMSGHKIQPGLAVRIAPSGPNGEGTKGIAIEQNIYARLTRVFNIHSWNSTASTYDPFTKAWSVRAIVKPNGRMIPPPWHMCARTQGVELRLKLWTGGNPEPSWDDPVHVETIELPANLDYPGYSGGYIGHIHPGQTVHFSGMSSKPIGGAETDGSNRSVR